MIPNEPYILLIGAFPPPVGGVSVHIQRLQQLLQQDYHVIVIDLYGRSSEDRKDVLRIRPFTIRRLQMALKLLMSKNCKVAHFHVSAMRKFSSIAPLLFFITRKKTKLILTLHSGSFVAYFASLSKLRKKLLLSMLRRFDAIISVSKEQKEYLTRKGLNNDKVHVIPAFLPPTIIETESIAQDVYRLKQKTNLLLVSSGYALPLYGFDKIIEALNNKPEISDQIGLIFCFYNTYDEAYLEKLTKILRPGQNFKFFFDISPSEFSYLLSKTNIYVRATDRDGDAVAIREASFFNNQIIASDVIKREDGAILFDIKNIDSLSEAINLALQDKQKGKLITNSSVSMSMMRKLYLRLF